MFDNTKWDFNLLQKNKSNSSSNLKMSNFDFRITPTVIWTKCVSLKTVTHLWTEKYNRIKQGCVQINVLLRKYRQHCTEKGTKQKLLLKQYVHNSMQSLHHYVFKRIPAIPLNQLSNFVLFCVIWHRRFEQDYNVEASLPHGQYYITFQPWDKEQVISLSSLTVN